MLVDASLQLVGSNKRKNLLSLMLRDLWKGTRWTARKLAGGAGKARGGLGKLAKKTKKVEEEEEELEKEAEREEKDLKKKVEKTGQDIKHLASAGTSIAGIGHTIQEMRGIDNETTDLLAKISGIEEDERETIQLLENLTGDIEEVESGDYEEIQDITRDVHSEAERIRKKVARNRLNPREVSRLESELGEWIPRTENIVDDMERATKNLLIAEGELDRAESYESELGSILNVADSLVEKEEAEEEAEEDLVKESGTEEQAAELKDIEQDTAENERKLEKEEANKEKLDSELKKEDEELRKAKKNLEREMEMLSSELTDIWSLMDVVIKNSSSERNNLIDYRDRVARLSKQVGSLEDKL